MYRPLLVLFLLLIVTGCGAAHSTGAPANLVGQPPTSLVSPNDTYPRQIDDLYRISTHQRVDPGAMALGSDGNVYFTEGLQPQIGMITPFGKITEYPIPSGSTALGITPGLPGSLWFGDTFGIGKISTGGAITEYTLPNNESIVGLVLGPDQNIWFTDSRTDSIGKLVASPFQVIEYPLPTPNALPQQITVGADGNLWFTEMHGNKIGRITPAGTISEFAIPVAGAEPLGITLGSDGAVYATAYHAPIIIKVTPAGTLTTAQCCNGQLYGRAILQGNRHRLWISLDRPDNSTGGSITKYDAATGGVTPPIVVPKNTDVGGMVVGADGDIWFSGRFGGVGGYIAIWEEDVKQIGINLNGEISIIDPNYGFELGYAIGTSTVTRTVRLHAGENIQFLNIDSIPHSAAYLGRATKHSAPWPTAFNGATTQSPKETPIGSPGFSTGSLLPGQRSLKYDTGLPGFYMFGCQYHYDSNQMRAVIVVE